MIEEILRWVSTLSLTAAAVLATLSARRWSHHLIRPGMTYTAIILWVVSGYRWWLTLGQIEPNTEPAFFIRSFVSVAFFAMAVGFSLHALATREAAKKNVLGSSEGRNNGNR